MAAELTYARLSAALRHFSSGWAVFAVRGAKGAESTILRL